MTTTGIERPTVYELKLAAAYLVGREIDKQLSVNIVDAEILYNIFEQITKIGIGNELTNKQVIKLSNEFKVPSVRIVRARKALIANGWTGNVILKERKINTCRQYNKGINTCSKLKYVLAEVEISN